MSPISKADKPLPSPPVARVSYPSGPAHSSRSLIDATERPFHCPPGTAQEEAWRPISPQKPTRYSSQGHTRDSKRDILYPLSSLPAEVSAKTNRIIDKDEAVSAVFDTPAVQGLESDQLSPSSQTGISETSASGKDSSTISQDSVALENTSGAIKFSPERSSDKLVVDLESPYCNKCENEGDKKHSVFHPVCKPNGNTQCSALDMEVYHSKNQGIGESYTLRHKYLILPSGDLYRHLSSTSEAKAAELGGSLRIDIEASKYLSNGNTDGLFSGQETRHVSDDRNVVRLRSRRDATSDSQTSLDFSSPISASGESVSKPTCFGFDEQQLSTFQLLVSKRQRRLTSLQASRLSPTPAKLPGHSRRVSPHANLLLSPATSTKTGPPYSGNDTNQQASLSLKKETKSYPNVKSVPVNRASNTLSEPPKHSVQSVGAKVEAINLPYSTSTPEPVRSVVPVARTTIFSPRKTSKSQRHISLLTARDDFTKVTRYISSPEKNLMKRGSSSAETGRNAAANLNSKNSAITNANGGDVDANSSITKNARSPLKMRNAVTTIRGLFSKRHSVSGENNDRVHGDKTQENNNTSVSRKSNASSTHTSKSHRKPTKVSSYRQSSKNETRSPRQPRTPNSTFEPQIFNPYSFEKTKTLAKSFVEGVKMMPDGEAKNREKLSIQVRSNNTVWQSLY